MSDAHNKTAPATTARLLRLPQVCNLVGLSRSAILTRVARGEFPQQLSLGARAVAWREAEVLAWIAARAPAAVPAPVEASRARDAKIARTKARRRQREAARARA